MPTAGKESIRTHNKVLNRQEMAAGRDSGGGVPAAAGGGGAPGQLH